MICNRMKSSSVVFIFLKKIQVLELSYLAFSDVIFGNSIIVWRQAEAGCVNWWGDSVRSEKTPKEKPWILGLEHCIKLQEFLMSTDVDFLYFLFAEK